MKLFNNKSTKTDVSKIHVHVSQIETHSQITQPHKCNWREKSLPLYSVCSLFFAVLHAASVSAVHALNRPRGLAFASCTGLLTDDLQDEMNLELVDSEDARH